MRPAPSPTQRLAQPGIRELAGVIFRAGNFTFGGGGPTFAILLREMVHKRHWMDDSGYALCYALSRVTPGTNMIAFYTAAGWLVRRWRGAIVALLAGSIPCCIFVWLVTAGFERIHANRWVQAGISGALAATVGTLLAAFWLLVSPYMDRRQWKFSAAVVAASIVLSFYLRLAPIPVLALAAVAGFFNTEPAKS